jgi:adenosine deaminase
VTDADAARLAANSFEAAFVEDGDRVRWLAEVDAWSSSQGKDQPTGD